MLIAQIAIYEKDMNKILATLVLIFSFSALSAQESWELLNPKPSSQTGLDIHFVSNTSGFYITGNELFYTIDSGGTWLLKQNFLGAKDLGFKDNLGIVVGNNGAIIKSEDSGVTWSSMNVGVPESLNTVTIIDQNNMVVSGNNSIFSTTDGGVNWQQKNIPSSRVNKTFFTSSSVGHAVTDDGQIFKTVDGGENWYVTASFTNISPNTFFKVFFKNENVGFATREHTEYYKTIDGGETWQLTNTRLYEAIFSFYFINDLVGFGAGESGIFKTIDGGDSWSRIAVDLPRYQFTDMYGVFFFDENLGYSVGQRGRIAKTVDSGQNWELYSPIDININRIEFPAPNVSIISFWEDFYSSADGGHTWSYLGTPSTGSYPGHIEFVDEDVGFTVAGNNKVFKTVDGGQTWIERDNFGLNLDNYAYSLEFVNENLGFISGGYNSRRLYKTTDGGNIWRVVLQESFSKIQFLDDQTGFASERYRGIYKTTDGGENWVKVFSHEHDINAIHFLDKNMGYIVGDQGLVYKTIDGGTTWQKLNISYNYYSGVRFLSKNVGFVYDDYGKIYKTENGGFSWNLIYTHGGLNDIAINDLNEIYLVGDYGRILKSQITYEDASIVVNEAKNIGATSVNIESFFASNSGMLTNMRLEYGEKGRFDNQVPFNGTIEIGNNKSFLTSIPNLIAGTEYNFRAIATYDDDEYVSNIGSFTTLKNYDFTLSQVYNFNSDTAEVFARVVSNNKPVTEITFEYGTDEENFIESVLATPSIVTISDGNINVQSTFDNLVAETTYYVRVKAVYDGESIYSNVINFTTRPEYRVQLYNPILSGTEASIRAVVYAYKDDLTQIVVEYGEEGFENEKEVLPNAIAVNSSGQVTATLTGLASDKTYYYRIRGSQGGELVYGPEGIFSFSESIVLLVDEVNDVKRESAIVSGRVYSSNNYLSNLMIEYGTSLAYGNIAFTEPYFSGLGATTKISGLLPNLLPGTTYNYRIKATDSDGDRFSENATFTTLDQLPIDNYSITTTSETCVDKDNGTLRIEAVVPSNYEALLNGISYIFSDMLFLENLTSGIYSLCIKETGGSLEQCFEFNVSPSETLSGKTTIEPRSSKNNVDVLISKGTMPYSVFINDEKIGEFTSTSFSFEADSGDEIEIASKYECEGTLSIHSMNGILIDSYINPVESEVIFDVAENNEQIFIQLFDLHGGLLKSVYKDVENQRVSLDLLNYPSGLYLVKLHGKKVRTHKVLKR